VNFGSRNGFILVLILARLVPFIIPVERLFTAMFSDRACADFIQRICVASILCSCCRYGSILPFPFVSFFINSSYASIISWAAYHRAPLKICGSIGPSSAVLLMMILFAPRQIIVAADLACLGTRTV